MFAGSFAEHRSVVVVMMVMAGADVDLHEEVNEESLEARMATDLGNPEVVEHTEREVVPVHHR